ncbi:hypothetical protein C8Q74DRAFT_1300799 [Fomes fomentarius]|nr:hypothetical protein C8Q74DRAFT_1300799 [Fomes fomentarius]
MAVRLFASVLLVAFATSVLAIGQDTCVQFESSPSSFAVVNSGKATPILLSPDEWPGVQRAASDFASDIQQVTGVQPTLENVTSASFSSLDSSSIIVGTLGKSSLIDEIVNRTKLDVSSIQGKWEAFIAKEVANPLPGVESAYVVIGSDKRGTIFALYDHSEQFDSHPCGRFADVPATKHNQLFVASSGCSHGSPSVKYRGIFFNDEQPALQSWAMEKFTNGTGAPRTNSPFNHFFYSKVFELILRMKGNYLWPGDAFGTDDPQNQLLADWFGIVMGTSHEEPMMRSVPVEWNLFGNGAWDYGTNKQNVYDFWKEGIERAKPYEGLYTIGMRGNEPLSEGQNIDLLEEIVADQRQLLMDVFNTTDATTIPQVWTLYKEVEGYYDDGMRVPDDVVLLWSDDNWGNVRRYPLVSERNRTGGSGVYYHLDYVGGPRSYKWITTFDQMSAAVARNATTVWILNVGDLKPYEMHSEFFLTLGWDAEKWTPTNLHTFVTGWAQREFDVSASDAEEVARIIGNVMRHNARRKPELCDSATYSLTNYREAENVLAMLQNINTSSTRIYNSLPSATKPAFFQLVHHPVQATVTLASMWIAAGINNLRASQARLSANDFMDQVFNLFDQDYALEVEYHSILNGTQMRHVVFLTLDHMMDQTHVIYSYWQQPMANTMPPVSKMQPKKQALSGAMRIIPEGSAGAWPGDNRNNCAQGYCPNPSMSIDSYVPTGNRFVDVAAGGPTPFTFTATSQASWLDISPPNGSISPDSPEQRVFLSVDWSKVTGVQSTVIKFAADVQGQSPMSVSMTFTANHTVVPAGFSGFVEGDGTVSIEAAHASRNTTVEGLTWTEIPGIGKTVSGVTPWPRGGQDMNFTAGSGPSIEYDFFLFNTKGQGGNVTITTLVSPSLNGLGDDRPLGIALQIDNETAQTSHFVPRATPGNLPNAWDGLDGWVADSIIQVPMVFSVKPGAHTLKVWIIEPSVVVQKIVIDTGGLRPSYLGPPESVRM